MIKSNVLFSLAISLSAGASFQVGLSGPALAQSSDHQTSKAAIDDANANQPARNGQAGRLDQPPIHGWHPIKRALQPIQGLEKNGVQLEQQIMKMEAPIKDLHPPMVNLQDKATSVSANMSKMQNQMGTVSGQMSGVRSDLSKMKKDIAEIKGPIVAVRKPLEEINGPIEGVKKQLNMVLMAIIFAGFAICLGTPVVAVLMYRYRDSLFPADVAGAAEMDLDDEHDDDDCDTDCKKEKAEKALATAGG
jgi:archaellum component FlaC